MGNVKLMHDKQLRQREQQLWLEIGQRLKLARKAALLSQEQMAKKLGVSRQRWSMVELGKRPLRPIQLFDACVITNVDEVFIFRGDERGVAQDVRSRMRQARKLESADNGG